jgi:hypothetical protein
MIIILAVLAVKRELSECRWYGSYRAKDDPWRCRVRMAREKEAC